MMYNRGPAAVYKDDEIFGRMSADELVNLVLSFYRDDKQRPEDNSSDNKVGDSDSKAEHNDIVKQTLLQNGIPTVERPTLQSVIRGVGEFDFSDAAAKEKAKRLLAMESPVSTDCPYLLLDIADTDSFQKCHIVTAHNYPQYLISRSVSYETREMSAYKNLDDRWIIVYDWDETDSPRIASTLVQRGYDNLYLLTGGMKEALNRYRLGLVTGEISKSLLVGDISGEPQRSSTAVIKRSKSVPSLKRRRAPTSLGTSGTGSKSKIIFYRKKKTAVIKFPERKIFSKEDLDNLAQQMMSNAIPIDTLRSLAQHTKASQRKKQEQLLDNKPKRPAWR